MYDNSKGRISPKLLRASQPVIEHIKGYEKLRLFAYDDGFGTLTIGWGHTGGVRQGQIITEAEARRLLQLDIQTAEGVLRLCHKFRLYQFEYDALVSFIFNIGGGNFLKSTMREALDMQRHDLAADEFGRWIYSKGKKARGLIPRRAVEERIFREGTYHAK